MRTVVTFLVVFAAATAADAQSVRANIVSDTLVPKDAQVIPLWPEGAPGALGDSAADKPTLTVFPAPAERASGAAAVVFPGGGYGHLATGKEGVAVAHWLNTLGVTAFVVKYRLGPRYHHPAMLDDALRAMRVARSRAAEWHVDPLRVGVMGFSAGGHLASTVGTHFADSVTRANAADTVSARPNFMVLVYPVITLEDPLAHRGSRTNLLGATPDTSLVRFFSNETRVTPLTPPTFLVASTDDATVPVENTIQFYLALHAAKVPAELHVYESGRHGFGLAPNDPYLGSWLERCAAWMARYRLVTSDSAR